MDKLTKEQRRKNMQAVRSKGRTILNAIRKDLRITELADFFIWVYRYWVGLPVTILLSVPLQTDFLCNS